MSVRVAIDAMTLSERDTGVGVWTRGLIRALDAFGGADEYLIYHGLDAAGLPRLRSHGARYVPVELHNACRLRRIFYEQALLPGRLRRDGVDVLHCPAYIRPLRARMPVVLTVHDLFTLTHPELCKRLNVLHFRLAFPRSIRRAQVIHCTSEWTKQSLAELFPDEAQKAHVITPGVDDIFHPSDRAPGGPATLRRLGLAEPPLLFVGNVEPKKNLEVLLAAYAQFRKGGAPNRLLMVGGPGWRSRGVFQAMRRLGLEQDVVRTGYVPRHELPGIYRASLALVFPSLVEGFGLPPLEAMACGLPVICATGSGLAESVGNAALTVQPDDVEALARAMRRLAESADLRAVLSGAGLARARHFQWRDRAGQFRRLYRLAAGLGAV
jgi:glycosyltransferase involved in cell wall biosynthesis